MTSKNNQTAKITVITATHSPDNQRRWFSGRPLGFVEGKLEMNMKSTSAK